MTDAVLNLTLNRRTALAGLALAGLSGCGPGRAASTQTGPVPLPPAEDIRRSYEALVAFGPRLPGNANHLRFVDWMAEEFEAAGLTLGPCSEYAYPHWDPHAFGLGVGEGDRMRAVPDVAYYVRSEPTDAEGVSGPLVYGGRMSETGPVDLGDVPTGAIVVFSAELPVPTLGSLVGAVDYVHGVDSKEAYLNEPYKRLWLTPAFPLEAVRDKGGAGVVIVMDVSSDMIGRNFSPHSSDYKPPLPALFVGQDVGADLIARARAGEQARLTLHADWVDGMSPSILATLPGRSDEVMILNTHTDGQNFIEENGCIALLQLARHFATLPEGERLNRTIVFAAWPGHMAGTLPQCEGWIRSHQDIVGRTAAAFTIEHLGATEWEDVPGKGYAATGRNEYMNCPATGGPLRDLVIAGLKTHDLKHHGAQVAPGITVGSAFHETGVPHAGFICGPNYLLGMPPNGHIDKLDADLAARQMQMLAELIKAVDKIDAASLRGSDATLGANPIVGEDSSQAAACRAAAPT